MDYPKDQAKYRYFTTYKSSETITNLFKFVGDFSFFKWFGRLNIVEQKYFSGLSKKLFGGLDRVTVMVAAIKVLEICSRNFGTF